MPPEATLLRPTEPLVSKPAGFLELATYSSLMMYWRYLAGADAQGRVVSVVRGGTLARCRRRVAGYTVSGAGVLLDEHRLLSALDPSSKDDLEPYPALLALLDGDRLPLRELLSTQYQLQVHVVLAFTRNRDLILRPELTFVPLHGHILPRDLPLHAKRLGRDELHVLLKRACGM